MKFKKALVFACVIAIPFAANAAFKDVTVNGWKITAAEQEQILAAATAHGQKRTPQLEQAIRDNLIARTVVLQEAEKSVRLLPPRFRMRESRLSLTFTSATI